MARRLTEGNYSKSDFRNSIKRLYDESLMAGGADKFVESISESLLDYHDYQRLVKRVTQEAITYINHVTRLTFNMGQQQSHQLRAAACEKSLAELYMPQFKTDCRMTNLTARYAECHEKYSGSFFNGIPNIKVGYRLVLILKWIGAKKDEMKIQR